MIIKIGIILNSNIIKNIKIEEDIKLSNKTTERMIKYTFNLLFFIKIIIVHIEINSLNKQKINDISSTKNKAQ